MNAAATRPPITLSPSNWSVRYANDPNEETALRAERDYYKALADSHRMRATTLEAHLRAITDLFDADDPHMDPIMATHLRQALAALKQSDAPR